MGLWIYLAPPRWYEAHDTADYAEVFISPLDFAEACMAAPPGSYIDMSW
jgi:hypothetical protein